MNTNLVTNRRLDFPDGVGAVAGWNAELRQTEPGAVRVRETILRSPGCVAMRVGFSRSFHQVGSPPNGMITVGLPEVHVRNVRWCGISGAAGSILSFNRPSGFEGHSERNFSAYTLSLTPDTLARAATALGLEWDPVEVLARNVVWDAPGHRLKPLRSLLDQVFTQAVCSTAPPTGSLLERDVPMALLSALAETRGDGTPAAPSARNRAVLAALELIDREDGFMASVGELCERVGVSAPTLYRGFHEHVGIGPKRYLLNYRLGKVRRDLLAGGRGAGITDIANRWGFWHLGQFASDYRRQYGERPSTTYRKSANRKPVGRFSRPRPCAGRSPDAAPVRGDESDSPAGGNGTE